MQLELLYLNSEAIIAESALSRLAATIAMLLAVGGGGKMMHSMLKKKGIDADPQTIQTLIADPEVQAEAERIKRKFTTKIEKPVPKVVPLTNEEEYLARILFSEAANQDRIGKEAVAQVIMNRVASKKRRYPNDIIGVITARNAFEAYPNSKLWRDSENPDTLDSIAKRAYDECVEIAHVATSGKLPNRIGDAILYHDTSITKPWGDAAVKTAEIGDLIFYKEVILR